MAKIFQVFQQYAVIGAGIVGLVGGITIALGELTTIIEEPPKIPVELPQNPSNPTRVEPPQEPPNRITEWHFPMARCGDLPVSNASKTHPVYVYRVLIDHTGSNLQTVKSEFCGDAYPRSDGYIQVASFANSERASHFQELMFDQFQSGTVEPYSYEGSE